MRKTIIMMGLLFLLVVVSSVFVSARSYYDVDLNDNGCGGTGYKYICGNGRVDPGEECDDGNNDACDGCDACRIVDECSVPEKEILTTTSYSGGSPTYTKRHWVTTATVGCKQYAFYETFRFDDCKPYEIRCHVKQYRDRTRMSWVC